MVLPGQNVVGVILAGGKATRMSGADKALMELHGRPMLAHVIERIAGQVDDLWLNVNRDLAPYQHFELPMFPDTPAFAGLGPLAGIHAALELFQRQLQSEGWLVVVACDTPWLPLDLAERLIRSASMASRPAAVACDGLRCHPTFSALHSSLLSPVTEHLRQNKLALGRFLDTLPAVKVAYTDQPEAFININTPGDLSNACHTTLASQTKDAAH